MLVAGARAKKLPLVGEQVISTFVPQLSVAVGAGKVTYAPAWPPCTLHWTLVTLMLSKGQVIVGGVRSSKPTVPLACPLKLVVKLPVNVELSLLRATAM